MTQTTISKVISLVIIAVLSIAFIDSTARADNASGVTYRSVVIDGVDITLETHGQEIADLMRDFLNRQLQSPLVAN